MTARNIVEKCNITAEEGLMDYLCNVYNYKNALDYLTNFENISQKVIDNNVGGLPILTLLLLYS